MRSFWLILLLGFIQLWSAEVGHIVEAEGNVTISRFDRDKNVTELIQAIIKKDTAGKPIPVAVNKLDTIRSGALSRAKLLFIDGTVITVGKDTEFKIARYYYDEKRVKGKVNFNFAKGAFRSITGQIGKISPEKFKLRTQTATIGIRGTDLMGLIGPGTDKIACKDGEVRVASADGEGEVAVKAGEITQVAEDRLPLPARPYTPDELEEMLSSAGVAGDELKQILRENAALQQQKSSDQNQSKKLDGNTTSGPGMGTGFQGGDDADLEKIFKF